MNIFSKIGNINNYKNIKEEFEKIGITIKGLYRIDYTLWISIYHTVFFLIKKYKLPYGFLNEINLSNRYSIANTNFNCNNYPEIISNTKISLNIDYINNPLKFKNKIKTTSINLSL